MRPTVGEHDSFKRKDGKEAIVHYLPVYSYFVKKDDSGCFASLIDLDWFLFEFVYLLLLLLTNLNT